MPDLDAALFAERVARLLEDPASARAAGEAAALTVAERFSVERMTSQVEAIYDKFLP